ncbi:MAG: M14 family metallopeptidase [Wenzhouxiangellaceae bacterium]|nr:M14 family metallopeptidase [Wenzhouxiangellaceae bacterium]
MEVIPAMQVTLLDHLPTRLLEHPATALHRHLAGPTLIHLPGRRPEPLFVSVLQHGNEPSGWDAIRRLLSGRYQRDPLPRSLVLYIGNIEAAAAGQRHLPEQPDMNRCWPGSRVDGHSWTGMLAEVTRHLRALKPFASIDIHNNTGENPHYAAVNRIDAGALNLASRFSRTVVYFTEPTGVQSAAFVEFCPAVTLECGPPGQRGGTDHALAFVETILNTDRLDAEWPHPEDIDLFQVTTVIRVPERLSFGFGPQAQSLDLAFDARIDQLNFTEIPAGTRLARTGTGAGRLLACDTDGNDCSSDWFRRDGDDWLTRRAGMPAMLTTSTDAVRQDCLCYMMERVRMAARHRDEHPELPEIARRATSPDPGTR